MSIFTFIKEINKKIKELDEKAQNPFIKSDAEYNPFYTRTYVWIEEDKEKEK